MTPTLSEPLPTRVLLTREQIILLKGSKLNGFLFPPWTTSPDASEFELRPGESPYLYVSKETVPTLVFPNYLIQKEITPNSNFRKCNEKYSMDGIGQTKLFPCRVCNNQKFSLNQALP